MNHVKYNPETELGVIGTLIAIGDGNSLVVQKSMLQLSEHAFYVPVHKQLFGIIKKCYDSRNYFDELSMMDNLSQSDNDLYQYFLKSISQGFFSENRLEHDINSLLLLADLRKQYSIMSLILQSVSKEAIPELASQVLFAGIQQIGAIKIKSNKEGISYEQIADNYFNGLYKAQNKLPTAIKSIDNPLDGGIENRSLVTIAGSSGTGKTYFSIYLMHHMTKCIFDKQVLFFSLEMPEEEIWKRHLSIIKKKQFDKLDSYSIKDAISELLSVPTTIYGKTRADIDYIETVCRLKSQEMPLSVVVVDYIGLVESKSSFERHDLKLGDVSKRLAALAIDLNCVVIALSQVNRNPDARAKDDRCPYPSDAADSSGGLRSSSLWLGIDRPETYSNLPVHKNIFNVKCRKNRYGNNFEAQFSFNNGIIDEVYNPFINMDDDYSEKFMK